MRRCHRGGRPTRRSQRPYRPLHGGIDLDPLGGGRPPTRPLRLVALRAQRPRAHASGQAALDGCLRAASDPDSHRRTGAASYPTRQFAEPRRAPPGGGNYPGAQGPVRGGHRRAGSAADLHARHRNRGILRPHIQARRGDIQRVGGGREPGRPRRDGPLEGRGRPSRRRLRDRPHPTAPPLRARRRWRCRAGAGRLQGLLRRTGTARAAVARRRRGGSGLVLRADQNVLSVPSGADRLPRQADRSAAGIPAGTRGAEAAGGVVGGAVERACRAAHAIAGDQPRRPPAWC